MFDEKKMLYTQTDMIFKKTRKNAFNQRKYGVLTVGNHKNAVFTNSYRVSTQFFRKRSTALKHGI